MAIDPVLLLVRDLRESEKRLVAECKLQSGQYSADRAGIITGILQQVRGLHRQLVKTAPTSAIGSSELIRIAGQRLPASHGRYAWHLNDIADRLAEGRRLHSDLIWVRALADALAATDQDQTVGQCGTLLVNAIRGAAMPVLVYRGLRRQPELKPKLEELPQLFTPPPFG